MEIRNQTIQKEKQWQQTAANALPIADALAQAWDKRNAGDVDAAYNIYLDLMAEKGIFSNNGSMIELWEQLEKNDFQPEDIIDFLLLDISFLRNQRNLHASNTKLTELSKILEKKQIRRSHRFQQQQGLNYLATGNLSQALECFILAKKSARNEKEFHLAYLNSILCMEDLSLEFKHHLEHFLKSFEPFEKMEWTASIQGQIQALRLRCALKNSQISMLDTLIQCGHTGEQAMYYSAWLAKLPTLALQNGEERAMNLFSTHIAQNGFSYLTNYRLRTLSTLLVAEDLASEVKLSEKIERIYLWTWQWLLNPTAALLEKILILKADLQKNTKQNLSFENYQMLELSLRWLGLFSGLSEIEIERTLKGWNFAQGNKIQIFTYESKLLDYLFSLRNKSTLAQDSKLSLLQQPAQSLEKFSLPHLLLASNESTKWTALRNSIQCLEDASQEQKQEGLTVELLKKKIIVRKNEAEEEILSPVLTQLLFLFAEINSTSKTHLVSACFGINRFDAFVHDPKISNLFSKANKLLAPFASFQTKGTQVFAKIDENKCRFLENSKHSLLLAQGEKNSALLLEESQGNLGNPQKDEINLDAFFLDWQCRQDFETLLSVSKATAARLLKAWVEDGLVETQGAGKNIKYKISEKLMPQLRKMITKKEHV